MIGSFRGLRLASIGLALAVAAFGAGAQHLHEGDIEVQIVGNKFSVTGNHESAYSNGYKIFEGNFGDFALGPHASSAPGFDSDNIFGSGEILWYRASGTLQYWNGSAWGVAPVAKTFTIEDAIGGQTFIAASSVTNPLGAIGQADAGVVHAHPKWSISNAGAAPLPAGAYMVTLSLTSTLSDGVTTAGRLESDPFYLVMNHGLSSTEFENAVGVLAVPEPETYAMLLAGLAVVVAARRRRASR